MFPDIPGYVKATEYWTLAATVEIGERGCE